MWKKKCVRIQVTSQCQVGAGWWLAQAPLLRPPFINMKLKATSNLYNSASSSYPALSPSSLSLLFWLEDLACDLTEKVNTFRCLKDQVTRLRSGARAWKCCWLSLLLPELTPHLPPPLRHPQPHRLHHAAEAADPQLPAPGASVQSFASLNSLLPQVLLGFKDILLGLSPFFLIPAAFLGLGPLSIPLLKHQCPQDASLSSSPCYPLSTGPHSPTWARPPLSSWGLPAPHLRIQPLAEAFASPCTARPLPPLPQLRVCPAETTCIVTERLSLLLSS